MKYVLSVLTVIAALFLMTNPKAASAAVGASLTSCLEVVIPSLFAFTVLAIYLQKSGLYRVALRPLTLPLSKLLRLDEELCAVFVLANIGGYPVGAKLLSELVNDGRISKEDAGKMLCCCFGSGPGFMVGIVGLRLFGSAAAGLVLFAAGFASSLLIAAFIRTRGEIVLKPAESRYNLTAQAFIFSVTSGAKVMFTVCAMITGFSVISALLREIGVYSLFEKLFSGEIFPALLEVTRISELSAADCSLPICAALLSFGGVCVLMQIAAVSGNLPLRGFVISRAAAIILNTVITLPFARRFPLAAVETITSDIPVTPFTKNAVLSVCVIIMCLILLYESRSKKSPSP